MPSSPEKVARYQFYVALGNALSTWAITEEALVSLAARLLGTTSEKTGTVFYSIANFHTWLAIIDELFELDERSRRHKSDWTNIAKTLRRLNDTRVRLAHQRLPFGPDEPGVELRPSQFDRRSK